MEIRSVTPLLHSSSVNKVINLGNPLERVFLYLVPVFFFFLVFGLWKGLMIAQCDRVSFTTWDAWIKLSCQSRPLLLIGVWSQQPFTSTIFLVCLAMESQHQDYSPTHACSWISFYMSSIITFILPPQGLIWFVFAALITIIMRWQQKHLAESQQQPKTVLGFDSSYMVLKQCKGLDVELGSEWLQFGWLVFFLALW